ncbi:MAG: hypothetical protein JSR21_13405 [Proteobacteria bacterium]|nr:hypothetical protein [Pseudomonadota bacterium]
MLRNIRPYVAVAIPLIALGVAGCVPTLGKPGFLDFIQGGATSQDDAFLHLGRPSGTFEGERILTWNIAKDANGYYEPSPSETLFIDSPYRLVLVFDAYGVLRRHALVPLKIEPGK